MKFKYLAALVLGAIAFSCSNQVAPPSEPLFDGAIEEVPFTSVNINDNFWAKRIEINKQHTIPHTFEQCELTGRVKNFQIAAGVIEGDEFQTGLTFDDTDIYKIIEGASYNLQNDIDPEMVDYIDSLIVFIEAAQEEDGYLMTAARITKNNPEKRHEWLGKERWANEENLSHELYNMGHLIESAIAHFQATNDSSLLKVAMKYADLAAKDFGWGKIEKAPGHQIPEMALVKLYKQTGKEEYLDLAKFLLDVKGQSDVVKNSRRGRGSEYSQAHALVTEQSEAVGHAVRATYMYSGMADIADMFEDTAYMNAVDKIWENAVFTKTYVTGGLGSGETSEGFGPNYSLPNMSAYSETCASIGNVYWQYRMFLLHGEAKYYDVLERTLYNALLSGTGLDGESFFYPNPLKSVGQHGRSPWFYCACCPSNVTRFIPSVPKYVYAKRGDKVLYVNLFISNEADIALGDTQVSVIQNSEMPFGGKTTITVSPESNKDFDLMIRIPGWAQGNPIPGDLYEFFKPEMDPITVKLNGDELDYTEEDGYIRIAKTWEEGDEIELEFPMDAKLLKAHPEVVADQGMATVQRGPFVYAAEWVDNPAGVHNVMLSADAEFEAEYQEDSLDGVVMLKTKGQALSYDEAGNLNKEEVTTTMIPYFAWANRGRGDMAVWMAVNEDAAIPTRPPSLASKSKVEFSTPRGARSSINDQILPKNSNDHEIPYYHWWPKNSSTEFISYTFPEPQTISTSEIYWYDDGPFGGCRIPDSYTVYYKDDAGKWVKVANTTDYEIKKDKLNTVTFEEVTTSGVKLEVRLPERHSAGLYEWNVE